MLAYMYTFGTDELRRRLSSLVGGGAAPAAAAQTLVVEPRGSAPAGLTQLQLDLADCEIGDGGARALAARTAATMPAYESSTDSSVLHRF